MYLILAFTLLHVVFYSYLAFGWGKMKTVSTDATDVHFSVIVPARNEEAVIQRVLACLAAQAYPSENYEVIVVNDFSEDRTLALVEECKEKLHMDLQIISLDDRTKSGKKHALTKGVMQSKYDYILTTDADCHMGPRWMSSFAGSMRNNLFVAGPVAIKGKGWFAKLQQMEFAGLIGFGAVTIDHNNPSMCSGANLGFAKNAFMEVGGYSDNITIPSGDDEFLLYNIMKRFPRQAAFLKEKAAIVMTPAQQSLINFINQRTRWTSKWKHNRNWKLRLMAVLFFLDYLLYYGLIVGMIMGAFSLSFTIFIMALRYAVDSLYLNLITRFHGNRTGFFSVLLIQIIYPLHVLFMGVSSIFGSYTWKGRKF